MASVNLGKWLVFILLFITITPLVTSETTKYQINQDVLISHPIRVNGGISSTVTANITVKNSSTILVYYKPMVYNTTVEEHQYNLAKGNISSIGLYDYCITAKDTTLNDTVCYQFEITTTGDSLSTSQGIIYSILFFLSLIVFFITLYGAFKIQWSNPRSDEGEVLNISDLKYAKMFCIVFSYVLFTFIMWIGWNLSYGYLSFSLMANFFKVIYYILISLMFPGIVLAFIVMVMRIYNDSKISELIDRGVSTIE